MKISRSRLKQVIKEELEQVLAIGDSGDFEQGETKDPDGYEGRMAKVNLSKICEYAETLMQIIKDDQNLEPWVQEKIAVAASMMDSVGHYMEYGAKKG
jgi:hypothetical protein